MIPAHSAVDPMFWFPLKKLLVCNVSGGCSWYEGTRNLKSDKGHKKKCTYGYGYETTLDCESFSSFRAPLDYVLAFWARLGRNFPFITPPEKRISLTLVILEIQFTVKRHKLLHCQSKVRQEERARVLFCLLCSCQQNGLHQSITALLILCHKILTWLHP